jgi:polyhydroxyalkanoate synthesis regulator phasin
MDAPGNGSQKDERDSLDRLVAQLGLRLDEARSLLEDATSRWRGDTVRVGEGTRRIMRDLARELGLVTRDDWDELELRVAQLEHRLRLVEARDDLEALGEASQSGT